MKQLLSKEEINFYNKNGYITPNKKIPSNLFIKMKSGAENVLKNNPDAMHESMINVHLENDNPEGIIGDKSLLEASYSPFILDKVEQLIGKNIILWGVSLFCKPPLKGKAIPWHQDGYYWPIRPLANCTVWIALDRATVKNGCLRVIKESHKNGLFNHKTDNSKENALNQALVKESYNENKAINLELEEGEISLHDCFLIHGSNQNKSKHRRAGLVLRYMPSTSVFDRNIKKIKGTKGNSAPNYAARPIFLVRGKDISKKNQAIKI